MKSNLVTALFGLTFLLSLAAAVMSAMALQRVNLEAGSANLVATTPERSLTTEARPKAASTTVPVTTQTTPDTPSIHATIRLPRSKVPATKDELETEATFVAEQLINLLPNQAISLHVLAMLKAQLHQTAEAEELWTRCIELDAAPEPYYVNLAAILLDRGKSDEAVSMLEKAMAAGIVSQDMSHHLGIALNKSGESERAVEVAQQALTKNPDSGALWLILGQAQLQLGQNLEAETSLRSALELGINSKAAYFALFNACMRLGKREEATGFRERYAAFKEKELSAEERYQILSEAEARRICVSVLSESAAVYLAIPDSQTAEHLLLRVLALEPENRAACEDLANIYAKRGELGNEIAVRERIIELDGYNLLNYLRLAKTFVSAKSPQDAEAQIKMAISFSPQMVTGYAAMADFLLEQQTPAKAQWYVEQAIRLKPTAQGFELLAKTLSAQGKVQEAMAAREMADEYSRQMAADANKGSEE